MSRYWIVVWVLLFLSAVRAQEPAPRVLVDQNNGLRVTLYDAHTEPVEFPGWTWIEHFYMASDNAGGRTLLYINTTGGREFDYPNQNIRTEKVWHEIDVVDALWGTIPRDAKGIWITGFMIATNKTYTHYCNQVAAFREKGSTHFEGNYHWQATGGSGGDSYRQQPIRWVPLKDGRMEFIWWSGKDGIGNDACWYGLNIQVIGWGK